jgi:hypothetical protein
MTSTDYFLSLLKVGDKYKCISQPEITIEIVNIEYDGFYLAEVRGYENNIACLTHWYMAEKELKYDYKKM